jgi:hypothetical protein
MDTKLNEIKANTFPDWYQEQQIEDYKECIYIGKKYLGDKMTIHDEYLIDLAAKMSINSKYKRIEPLTQEMLDNIKQVHKANMEIREFETPAEGWYTENSPLHTEHIAEILPHNIVDSSNIITDDTSNLVINDISENPFEALKPVELNDPELKVDEI